MEDYWKMFTCNENLNLCLNEKYEIAMFRGESLVNKWKEITSTCSHRTRYKLTNDTQT